MPDQFGRVVNVYLGEDIGAVKVSGLNILFNVSRTVDTTPDKAVVDIYNLAGTTRQSANKRFTYIILEAGYEDNYSRIFKGKLNNLNHSKNGTDIVTRLIASDGGQEYQLSYVDEQLKGASVRDLAAFVVSRMGLQLGDVSGLPDIKYHRDMVLSEPARHILERLSSRWGVNVTIQDGVVDFVRYSDTLGTAEVISQETGMIGSPSITEKGVTVTSLLKPSVRPNSLVDIRAGFFEKKIQDPSKLKRASEFGGGTYKVVSVIHDGTTRDIPFYTKMECVAI